MAKLIIGENDLATLHPDIAAEWHPTKNGELRPTDVTPKSNKKVWWLCKKKHEWENSVANRSQGRGCPICANKQVLAGFNDLASTNQMLSNQWHPTKNNVLTPSQVTEGSNKKVWWQCSEGHEWQATIASRKSGCNCPYCNGNKLWSGFNDLATLRPDVAKEWHHTKNNGLLPSQVTKASKKIVWWVCENGHEWISSINNRTSSNRGCPVCSKTKMIDSRIKTILETKGSLADTNPQLAAEWNHEKNKGLCPTQVTERSCRKVWWLCSKGHEWQATINSRSNGNDCPICANRQVLEGYNDLITTHPKLAAEWHFEKNGDLLPSQVVAGSNKTVWWKCSKGHEWERDINGRVSDNSGCPICSGHKVLFGFNDLATVLPSLAEQWHPTKNGSLTPQMITVGSNKKVWWKCANGHEWRATVSIRKSGTGCPICIKEKHTSFPEQSIFFYLNQFTRAENRFMLNGNIEIDIFLPEYGIGIEYDGEKWHQDPQKDSAKNKLCETAGVRLIRVREPGCPPLSGECIVLKSLQLKELEVAIRQVCALLGKTVDINIDRDRFEIFTLIEYAVKKQSLASLFPNLAAEWHPAKNGALTPDKVMAGTSKKVWWQCAEGHEWEMKVSNRTSFLKQNCPICANQKVLSGYNDLATSHPNLAAEWHPTKNGDLTPQQVTYGTHKNVWWEGDCGHEWDMPINKRTSRNQGCPYCSNHRLLPGFNDLATTNPDVASEWHPTKNGDLLPADFLPGTEKRVWWQCAKGHEWEALIYKRTGSSGRGCPFCANKKVLAGYNDLETLNPGLAAEWHPTRNDDLTPSQVTVGSNKKVWWQCPEGHEWKTTIASRSSSGTGCAYCQGRRVISGRNDLATVSPEIAAEWHPTKNGVLLPTQVANGSGKKVWWKCAKGHEWEAAIRYRSKGYGCPTCKKQRKIDQLEFDFLSNKFVHHK